MLEALLVTLLLAFMVLVLVAMVALIRRQSEKSEWSRDELDTVEPTIIAVEAPPEAAVAPRAAAPDAPPSHKAVQVPVQRISEYTQHQATVADTGARAGDDVTPSARGSATGPRCRHGVPMQYHCELCARGATTPRERYERLYGDWTSD